MQDQSATKLIRVGIYTTLGAALVYGSGFLLLSLIRSAQHKPRVSGCLCGGAAGCTCGGEHGNSV